MHVHAPKSLAPIACHTTPAQEMCDMQSVQTECRTQFAQMACHATPVQEWSDMQSVQAECPNVDRLQSQRTTAHHIICNTSPALQQKNVHEMTPCVLAFPCNQTHARPLDFGSVVVDHVS